MTLTKAEITEHLFTEHELSKRDAKEFVDTLFETIRNTLEEGQHVKLSGFGNFELRDKGERPGRNPKTGEQVAISSRRVVTFKMGQKLKLLIEGSTDSDSPTEDILVTN